MLTNLRRCLQTSRKWRWLNCDAYCFCKVFLLFGTNKAFQEQTCSLRLLMPLWRKWSIRMRLILRVKFWFVVFAFAVSYNENVLEFWLSWLFRFLFRFYHYKLNYRKISTKIESKINAQSVSWSGLSTSSLVGRCRRLRAPCLCKPAEDTSCTKSSVRARCQSLWESLHERTLACKSRAISSSR